jgi:hypothetical protein
LLCMNPFPPSAPPPLPFPPLPPPCQKLRGCGTVEQPQRPSTAHAAVAALCEVGNIPN